MPVNNLYLALIILYLVAGIIVVKFSQHIQKDFWIEHSEHNKTAFVVILLLWPFAVYGMIRNHTGRSKNEQINNG